MKNFSIALAVGMLFFTAEPVKAYFDSDVLNTIENVSITSNDPDADSRKCGVTDYSPYKIALREALSDIGVSYQSNGKIDAYLEISMLKVEEQDLCVIVTILSFEYDLSESFEDLESEHWVRVYSDYVMGYAPVLDVKEYTTEFVEDAVEAFDSWR